MIRLVALLCLLLSATARADDTALSALRASTGVWEGELYYLDYQSGQRFPIPLRMEAEMSPDGATLLRRLTYTDPGVKVHAINLLTVDRDDGRLVEAYFRERRGQYFHHELTAAEFTSETRWRIVYEQDGTDDDRPARIRQTLSRDGDRLASTKEVRFLDEEDGAFFLRNGTELQRR